MEKNQNYILSPTKVPEKKIYDIYCDNYDSIHHLFVEFQLSWLQQAYHALKDLDKYNILVFLYKENFSFYCKKNVCSQMSVQLKFFTKHQEIINH